MWGCHACGYLQCMWRECHRGGGRVPAPSQALTMLPSSCWHAHSTVCTVYFLLSLVPRTIYTTAEYTRNTTTQYTPQYTLRIHTTAQYTRQYHCCWRCSAAELQNSITIQCCCFWSCFFVVNCEDMPVRNYNQGGQPRPRICKLSIIFQPALEHIWGASPA